MILCKTLSFIYNNFIRHKKKLLQILSFVTCCYELLIIVQTLKLYYDMGEDICMVNKKILIFSLIVVLIVVGSVLFVTSHRKIIYEKNENVSVQNAAEIKTTAKQVPVRQVEKNELELLKKTHYYLPLISIKEMDNASAEARAQAENLLEKAQGFYLLKYDKKNKELFVILQNPIAENNSYARHNMQFAKISEQGEVSYENLGYTGEENELLTEKDLNNWVYEGEEDALRPVKHNICDENGDARYTEFWNYTEENPIKYEMKNTDGKVISVFKEKYDSNSGYTQEHVLYDSHGKTNISITANYVDSELKSFSYYDSDEPENNLTIVNEYKNGIKTEEKIYNSKHELIETIKPEYKDGKTTEIKIFDKSDKEVEVIKD